MPARWPSPIFRQAEMARKIRLYSPYAPVPLARILEKEMDREWTQKEKNKGRVMGAGTEEKITLRYVRYNIRNDFSTCLTGKMVPDRGGTMIKARLGRARSLKVFMTIWFGFLIFFMLVSTVLVGSQDIEMSFKLPFFGIPLLMMLAGVGMLKFGGKDAAEHEEKILAFLADKAKAQKVRSLG
ncbi:MAG: hypothetical protein COA41_07875 [Sphingopyxis sp.]|nr:MAG: hypothetical protein COA41_07875 [Sphingopyxis sp.]